MDKIVRASIADLFINISAGWFGAAYGVLFLAEASIVLKLGILIFDIMLAIICLYLAIKLRRRIKK